MAQQEDNELLESLKSFVDGRIKLAFNKLKDKKSNNNNKKKKEEEVEEDDEAAPAASTSAPPAAAKAKRTRTTKPFQACAGNVALGDACPIAVADQIPAPRTKFEKKYYDTCKKCKKPFTEAIKMLTGPNIAAPEGGEKKKTKKSKKEPSQDEEEEKQEVQAPASAPNEEEEEEQEEEGNEMVDEE